MDHRPGDRCKGRRPGPVDNDRYLEWFNELPESTRTRMAEAWGNPPGEEKDGIPAAMVYDGKILVTGLRFGNVVVCVQPKRGCAGARCDGQVCKILHDPSVPPPHQYIATYKWLSREFGADAVVHVGTHGNLEFLPGKATGLSSGCLPDVAIDTMPNLYIYNADNPPEGTIAKRRANAVLVDHMQTVMVKGELYGDLDELERLLAEYGRYRQAEPAKAHTISHMIIDRVKTLNLIPEDRLSHEMMDEAIVEIHEKLSLLKDTYIPKGMHIFGRIPQGADRAELIYAILRYESGPGSLHAVVSDVVGRVSPAQNGDLEEAVEATARGLCREWMEHGTTLADGMGAEYALPSRTGCPGESRGRPCAPGPLHLGIRRDGLPPGGLHRRLPIAGAFRPHHAGQARHPPHGQELLLPRPPDDPHEGRLGDGQAAGRQDPRPLSSGRGRLPGEHRLLLAVHRHHVVRRGGHGPDDVPPRGKACLAGQRQGEELRGDADR